MTNGYSEAAVSLEEEQQVLSPLVAPVVCLKQASNNFYIPGVVLAPFRPFISLGSHYNFMKLLDLYNTLGNRLRDGKTCLRSHSYCMTMGI